MRVFRANGRRVGLEYYREYIEVMPDDDSAPYAAEIRLCHDFPEIQPNDGNQLVVLDDRVAALMGELWAAQDMPTDTWQVMAC